jgi:hypothetical protein
MNLPTMHLGFLCVKSPYILATSHMQTFVAAATETIPEMTGTLIVIHGSWQALILLLVLCVDILVQNCIRQAGSLHHLLAGRIYQSQTSILGRLKRYEPVEPQNPPTGKDGCELSLHHHVLFWLETTSVK